MPPSIFHSGSPVAWRDSRLALSHLSSQSSDGLGGAGPNNLRLHCIERSHKLRSSTPTGTREVPINLGAEHTREQRRAVPAERVSDCASFAPSYSFKRLSNHFDLDFNAPRQHASCQGTLATWPIFPASHFHHRSIPFTALALAFLRQGLELVYRAGRDLHIAWGIAILALVLVDIPARIVGTLAIIAQTFVWIRPVKQEQSARSAATSVGILTCWFSHGALP